MRRLGRSTLFSITRMMALVLLIGLRLSAGAQDAATTGAGTPSAYANMLSTLQQVTINVAVRDARGLPLDEAASIHLTSQLRRVNRFTDTKESATVSFANLLEGPYEVVVECPGYRTEQQHLDVTGGSAFFTAYIYLHAVNDPSTSNSPPKGLALSPKAVSQIDKGLSAMRRKQYDSALNHFAKASEASPSNPDIHYLRGSAELRMGQTGPARKEFEQAVALDPSHEKALLALGEMQLQSNDATGAIATLNKTVTANGAGWKTYYLLASAYANLKQWKEGADAARHAVSLAGSRSAAPLLLLGEIESAEGHAAAARDFWQKVVADFPNTPETGEAKTKLAELSSGKPGPTEPAAALKVAVDTGPSELEESRPWAPPDVDSKEYYVTSDTSCNSNDVITRAMRRMKVQMANLEKFTAMEHIEHQEIDKHGLPGPIKARQFSYIVFVHPYEEDSVFLEESRDGGAGPTSFPTSLATIGLNSLGLSVLQPANRAGFLYQCQGVATVRGQAAWQVRFEEKKDANLGVRRWQRQGTIYNVPIKGRVWLSTTTFDILRVETDLREPMPNLELKRDHLQVEYGPINFNGGKAQLWLPWDAEMYMELHGNRYHHKHYLTDYLLFDVDASAKIKPPKGAPSEENGEPESKPDKP